MPVIERAKVPVPPVLSMLARLADIPEKEMFSTFNMGIGLCLVADERAAGSVMAALRDTGEAPLVIGHVAAGEGELRLC